MNAEEFVQFAASGWPSVSEKDYAELAAEEALQTRKFERDFRAMLLSDLFDICAKCHDRYRFAESYRKAKKQSLDLGRLPGDPSLSAKANSLTRDIQIRDMNIMLNCMAIWFTGMLGSDSRLAKEKVSDPNKVAALRHKEIEEYGMSTLPSGPSEQGSPAASPPNANSAGCAFWVLAAIPALGSFLTILWVVMA